MLGVLVSCTAAALANDTVSGTVERKLKSLAKSEGKVAWKDCSAKALKLLLAGVFGNADEKNPLIVKEAKLAALWGRIRVPAQH